MPSQNTFTPKHRRIFDVLREEILQGMHPNGKRLASEEQLVRHYGTSRPTVARALNELERLGLVERRPGSGTYVCGAPKIAGGLFALVFPDLHMKGVSIWGPISSQIVESSRRRRHEVLWGNLPDHQAWESFDAQRFCDDLIARKPLGVFFEPPDLPLDMNRHMVERFDAAGIAVVLQNSDIVDRPQRSKFDLVAIDNRLAGAVVAEHLLKLGVRRMVFVTPSGFPVGVEDRAAGCQDMMRKFGVDCREDFFQAGDPLDTEFVMAALGVPQAEAVVCVNTYTALRLLKTLTTAGLRVPEDVRLASFDDVEYATLCSPALTTLRIPLKAWGEVAVDTMFQRIERPDLPPRDILLGCELIVRESCGAQMGASRK